MKYIKDRFYNSRKRSPSLGAPALDLFSLWRANCFFLRVVSAKLRQLFESTKFSEKFFFSRASFLCLVLYIGVPRSHLREHLLYIVSVRTWGLNKETDKQLSSRQNLLTTQGSPDTSEDPFFWVASAKVIQLPETTKLSTNFFFGWRIIITLLGATY